MIESYKHMWNDKMYNAWKPCNDQKLIQFIKFMIFVAVADTVIIITIIDFLPPLPEGWLI